MFASFVHFWTITGTLKTAADRLYAELECLGYGKFPKKSVLLMTADGGDYSQAVTWYRTYEINLSWNNLGEVNTHNIDESLLKAILRKFDFPGIQFEKNISNFSEGQKKKVLVAKSLCEKTYIYFWDEPLNFIDILSRIQIENLILKFQPKIIFVEHDTVFTANIATKTVEI